MLVAGSIYQNRSNKNIRVKVLKVQVGKMGRSNVVTFVQEGRTKDCTWPTYEFTRIYEYVKPVKAISVAESNEQFYEDQRPIAGLREETNKYDRQIIGKDGTKTTVDVYRVLDAFKTNCPILDHLAKKALCAGMRGHKDRMQDLLDIKKSIEEAIKLEEQR